MIIWPILTVIVFYLFRRFVTSLEHRENREWKDWKLPLWAWIISFILCLVPFIAIILLVLFEQFIITDIIEDVWPEFRVKEGKTIYLIKITEFLNKKY